MKKLQLLTLAMLLSGSYIISSSADSTSSAPLTSLAPMLTSLPPATSATLVSATDPVTSLLSTNSMPSLPLIDSTTSAETNTTPLSPMNIASAPRPHWQPKTEADESIISHRICFDATFQEATLMRNLTALNSASTAVDGKIILDNIKDIISALRKKFPAAFPLNVPIATPTALPANFPIEKNPNDKNNVMRHVRHGGLITGLPQ